ncbi:MAG: hypothetical protein ACRD4U_07760 [Candidatus Acidiferrales bacterium]
MLRRILFSLVAILLLPGLLAAYTIVLKNGQRIEAQGRYTIEGNVAKFVDAGGRQRQVPLAEIDVAATERANASAAGVPGATAASEARRKPKVWSNDEIELLVRGGRISTVGEATIEAAPSEEAAAAEGAAAEDAEAPPAPQTPKEQTSEYWQERLKPLREEMAKVDQELQGLRSNQNRAASNAISITTNAPGVDVRDTIARLEQRRADLQRQIEDIQSEARRMGIPPGWVR